MPKIAKQLNRAEALKEGSEVMKRRGFSPLDAMIDMVMEEREMPAVSDPDAMGALLSGWLADYEEGPNGKLRLRRSLALKVLSELAGYAHPKVKASDRGSGGSAMVQVVIEGGSGKGVETNGKGDCSDFGGVEVVLEGGRG